MKKKSYILALLAAVSALLLSSCAKEKTVGVAEGELIECTLQAEVGATGAGLEIDTKVALNADGITPNWENGDQILVLDADKKPVGADGKFTLSSGAGTASGTFTGTVYVGQKATYAIYPASIYDPETGEYTLPMKQNGIKASAFKELAVMIGTVTGGNATLINACTVLKINTGDYSTIELVEIMAKNSALAGTFVPDWDNNKIVPNQNDGKRIVVVNSSQEPFPSNTDLYIVAIPAESQEFTFQFTNTTDQEATLTHTLELANSTIKNLGTAQGLTFEYVFVDLGLPSGTKWAKCNLGATSEEKSGDFYRWGETETIYESGHWKTGYETGFRWDTYKWCNGTDQTLTKYNTREFFGEVDGKTVLDSSDDAATVNKGYRWKMPGYEEVSELSANSTRERTQIGGVQGTKIISKINSNYIFIPDNNHYSSDVPTVTKSALFSSGTKEPGVLTYDLTDYAFYLSCQINNYSDVNVGYLEVSNVGFNLNYGMERMLPRCCGMAIRPVYHKIF